MAEPDPRNVGKIAVVCPHCGSKQAESVYARATTCRRCSSPYEIGPAATSWDAAEAEKAEPSLLDKMQKLFRKESFRTIHCGHCGAEQRVSSFSTSSICPQCSSYIELKDYKIAITCSRNIDTLGTVHITSKGDIASTRVTCGEAIIHGKMQGSLICTGTVRIKLKGRLLAGVEAQHLIIEKGASVDFARAISARRMEVHGKVSARVMSDSVSVTKTGCLEGTVYAKSIDVERGGIFQGEVHIGEKEMEQPELLPGAAKLKRENPQPEAGGGQPSLAIA